MHPRGGGSGMPGADDRVIDGRRGLAALVPVFEEEFPVYFFGTQETGSGVSLSAKKKDRAARPGVYAVITDDPDEMRRTLRGQQ